LFSEGNQDKRFDRSLHAALGTPEGIAILGRHSLTAKDIGAHSIRKGSPSFVLGAANTGVMLISVCKRVGWNIGLQNRYLFNQPGCDACVGRAVCGLDQLSADFGILPPHFPLTIGLNDALGAIYPRFTLDGPIIGVLSFFLGSLWHHKSFLKQNLPKKHAVLSSPLFSSKKLPDQLDGHIIIGSESPYMKATGVLSNAVLLKAVRNVQESINDIPAKVVQRVEEVLEQNGVAAGNVTGQQIFDHVTSAVQNVLSQHIGNIQQAVNAAPIENNNNTGLQLYMWQGGFSRVPEDFEFPDVNLAQAWQLWWLGSPTEGIPPYRAITPNDLKVRKKKQRLSDWASMMRIMKEALGDDYAMDTDDITDELINSQCDLAMERIPQNQKKRRVRADARKLTTALKEARAAFKRQRIGEDSDVSRGGSHESQAGQDDMDEDD
jgi:hypothetical protein